ncbi:MAG: hypothetical protein E4G93_04215 [Dehalococcoidia bacterium]|nr:MAG: hypothetical protein E4G93_04215 [Dehalococcoidia bacterium]
MKCPRCKSDLIVVEYHDIELDWCPSCEGLWFDSGEMELVAAQMGGCASTTDSTRKAHTDEERLKCPECNKKMDKRLLGDIVPVIADVCPVCDGLWLDRGELEQVVDQQQDPAAAVNPVIEHLRDTFRAAPDNHAKAPEGQSRQARK